jgi:hypothetical protein
LKNATFWNVKKGQTGGGSGQEVWRRLILISTAVADNWHPCPENRKILNIPHKLTLVVLENKWTAVKVQAFCGDVRIMAVEAPNGMQTNSNTHGTV